jgi:two-component system, LuxR family, sensor kinase FixL
VDTQASASLRTVLVAALAVASALLSAMPGFRWTALPVTLAAIAYLAWRATRAVRDAAREHSGSDELRRLNVALEGQVEARAADLRDSTARLQSIINSAVDGIIVIDHEGRIESFNPGAERLFGYSEAEVLGRNVSMLMPSPYREEHDGYLDRYLATGHAKIIGIGREVAGRRRDGTQFPVHLSVGEMNVEGARKYTGILHDLTQRVRMEEQLRERAALARVGEMAAVIAHEVKNPLAGVRGAIQVIGRRLPADGRDASIITEIVTRIDHLDQLIKDLLLFARPPQPRLAPVDVASLVQMTAALLCEDPSMRGIQVDVTGQAPPLSADAEMLKIVLQNLLVNSAHAMQGRGRVRVAIDAVDGVYRIAVSDSGPGIPEDIRDRIFTAFFTTKSRGTGLGLATAKRLIEAHHGEIAVDCPPGGGTQVTLTLPATQG